VWGRPEYSATAGEVAAPGNRVAPGVTPGEIISSGKELSVACGEGTRLRLEFVQLEGRKRITAQEFANGARLAPIDRFV
jgi:methionyl-tRNA formyltransferase